MFQVVVLGLIIALAWSLRSKHRSFLAGFASLLERPDHGRVGMRAVLTGVRYVGGELGARAVLVVLHPKRGRYTLGYLTLAMATSAKQSWSSSSTTPEASVSTSRMREALDTLIGRHGLQLDLESGWLTALWRPMGLFVFPGPFDSDKWREVLTQMKLLALELETADPAAKLAPALAAAKAEPLHV